MIVFVCESCEVVTERLDRHAGHRVFRVEGQDRGQLVRLAANHFDVRRRVVGYVRDGTL